MEHASTLLVVHNLTISKAFYVDVLGLKIVEEYDDSIMLSYGLHNIFMFQGTMQATDYEHGYHANSSLVLTVHNLDEKIDELKSKGVVFIHKAPNENRWGRYAAFFDPSGIINELMEFADHRN
ncbi:MULTISPECIES: VOC family protein [unclassified Shewanella]|uniref:VOC family protein n=1 Tax=unclassified Shewanella TaxID=196818 RepID=UPI001BBE10F4|nr:MULTISPECIES: VOC family protein [unclassified Shewanella]GIU10749.1 glyoxalase [Shewanella sp. MBTL60-112-B1]GIU32875.1 glyoxalase [Shewanella sp. MBTL60-112-B2]